MSDDIEFDDFEPCDWCGLSIDDCQCSEIMLTHEEVEMCYKALRMYLNTHTTTAEILMGKLLKFLHGE